jgi:hypothetical protein
MQAFPMEFLELSSQLENVILNHHVDDQLDSLIYQEQLVFFTST